MASGHPKQTKRYANSYCIDPKSASSASLCAQWTTIYSLSNIFEVILIVQDDDTEMSTYKCMLTIKSTVTTTL